MLDFIRHSRKVSISRRSSLRSSIDDAPSKASSPGDPAKVASTTPSRKSNPAHTSSLPVSQATLHRWSPKPLSSDHPTPHSSLQFAMPDSIMSAHAHPSRSYFVQGSSGISRPSPSLVAAHENFNAHRNITANGGDRGCVAQMDIEDALRDYKNPHGLTLDKSKGYFPQVSDVVPGSRSQSDATQLGDRLSFEDLLKMIVAERLHHMPQKGSNWDRSIRVLESFALRVSGYATRYPTALGNAELKGTMIYRECYTLLRLGRHHGASLVAALGMLTDVSRALSLFTSCPPQPTNGQLEQYLGQVLDRILDLINCLTCYFQDLPIGFSNITGPSELRCSLGKPLEAFDLQADRLFNEIWTHHIPSSFRDTLVNFKQVQLLLQPQDEVVRTTQKILHAERGSRHEFTCEWFSKPFLDFVRSSDVAIWINGRVGCGKSVLCGWILESLQGAVDGREYASIACSIDPRLPSETSTASVIKALLRQMVERQYRSSKLYEALAHLMATVTTGGTPIQVEEALCISLETAISEAPQPTMLVIDGLSEVNGGTAAAAALFNTLLHFTADNPLVRLMVLSRPFSFSPTTPLRRRTTEARDVHKDIYKVITDLVPTQSATPAAEVARRIEHEADGNFFWSLLAFQEWSAQNFSQQAWRTLPVSLEANVVSKIDFLDPMISIVLFNSIIATRPLRLVEIEIISRLDVHNRMLKTESQDITHVINNGCGSVLVVQEGIVLFRHALLKQALLDMLQFENLLLGPEMHADMACRLLLYIKVVLGQRSELTLKPMPSLALEDLFHAHPLLAYALRYWTEHLVSSSMFPEPGSFKPNSDCSAVFPDTVQAAIVEASYWEMDPSTESIRVLQIATAIRKEILGDHEATLQTAACLAEALRLRSDFIGAANYFYVASEIAQVALPEFHPFSATCMLAITETTLDMVSDTQSSNEAALQRGAAAKKSQGLTLDSVPLVNALIKKLLGCGRFDEVVAVGAETLHRFWPFVLDDSYGRDPVDTGPFDRELATIASSLAHAYSRTNQVECVGLVYWHLFHKARHSESVDDSSAVEYGNLALRAFEQTGQVHRMIALREDLLDLCAARDGERHSKTIEARYALASLYSQEELCDKARQQYTHIIDNLKQPTFYESAALPALRRLIEIYTREKRWDEAQATYAAVWDMFIANGLELGFDPSDSKALYRDYTTLLKKQDLADISRLHKITDQYRSVCSTLWGDQHSVTMEAVLWLADIELSLQSDNIEATQLFESIVDGEERVPPDQQDDAKATIEAAENRLTDLYEARINDNWDTAGRTFPLQGKAITRAVRLVGKRYQIDKTLWGISQPATLSTLATWVSLLSQDSRLVAIQELESAIHSLMESDVQPSSLYKAAVLLATSYSSNGFIEEGIKTVRGLMERVIFDRYAERSKLVFLAVFEAHLAGSVQDVAEVHAKILKMSALWECYQQVSQGTDPGLALASGARLRRFLEEHDFPERGTLIECELYERFLQRYGAAFEQGIETARDFFFLLLEELGSERLELEIPDVPMIASAALNNRAGSLLGRGEYIAALNLLIPGFEFLCFVEGFASSDHSVLTNVLRLGLMLAVPNEDQDVSDRMISLSKILLQDMLQQCRSQHLDLVNLVAIEQVSRVASVLGMHKSYEDLEWLLTRLWLSRKNLTFLSHDVVIRIGQRLVEVRFFHGHVDSAIELGEDIFYNVQRVYGTSHPCTVGIGSLLSTMYAATGDHAAAKAVIGDVSQLKRPDVKGSTGNEPNREHLLQVYKRSSGSDTVPTTLQAPKDWGFIDFDDDKGFRNVEDAM